MADQVTTSLAQAKVLVMEGQKGADGKSPYIGANGNWFVWNGTAWSDTGIPASLDDAQIAAVVEEYLSEHPVEVPVDSVNGKTGVVVLDASDVGALPANTPIPAAVTEQTVSGWGFTKNTGTYSKPSGGIPKTDLASDVQTSLGKADTALQQHQSLAGYATESYVQTQIANIPDELPTVTASDNGKSLVVENGAWAASGALQTKAITDTGNYFTTDTVEGALQEIGAELSGVNTLIGSGVIT